MVVVLVDKEMAAAAGVCKRNNDKTVVSALSRGDSSALVCGYVLCITEGTGQSKLAIYVKRGPQSVPCATADHYWVGATSKFLENQSPAATVDHSIPTFTSYRIAYESPIDYHQLYTRLDSLPLMKLDVYSFLSIKEFLLLQDLAKRY
jgi:hypothetical protein